MVANRATRKHKRSGNHQKRTQHFLKVYWPYLPLAVFLGIGLVFSVLWQPRLRPSVLAYATSMNVSALYQATNQDRAGYGIASLRLDSQLSQAAQAKASDMAARNYWSHNTPDGNPPWVFITNTGYKYKATGENLAYGYATSEDTVAAWMNSPEHKANMFNSTYTDVGFGFVNAPNYNGVDATPSEETIVVAFYAAPLTSSSATAPTAPTKSIPTPKSSPQTKADSQISSTPPSQITAQTPAKTPATNMPSTVQAKAVVEPATKNISRLSILTNGRLPWLASLVSATLIASLALLISRHALKIRKWWRKGERYLLQHAVFDVAIVSLVGLCLVLNHGSGIFIR